MCCIDLLGACQAVLFSRVLNSACAVSRAHPGSKPCSCFQAVGLYALSLGGQVASCPRGPDACKSADLPPLKLLKDSCQTIWWSCSVADGSCCERGHAAKDHWSLTASTCCLLSPKLLPVMQMVGAAGPPQAALQPGPQHAALLAAAG